MTKTKSPIKDKPLRYAAQSSDEAIDDLLDEKVLLYFTAIILVSTLVGWEWFRYYNPFDKPPTQVTSLALPVVLFCVYKIYRNLSKLKNLKLGRSGERVVCQYLESMRQSGAQVFHDILGDKFNVDHVVISNKGIFVIETKTYSKPEKGNATIKYDGERILLNGRESRSDIIKQAKAEASYIKSILKDSTGKEFAPFPVVLFPGWFVEGEGNRKGEMWVLEPKAFRKFVDAQQVKLRDEDVKLASYHLSRHIRTSSK